MRELTTRSGRSARGRFLAEGPQLVGEALAAGVVQELLCTPEAARRHPGLLEVWPAAPTLLDDRAAAVLSETVNPQGLLAVCHAVDVGLAAAIDAVSGLAVLLVEANDPGNAGTVLRTADAAGAQAVLFGAGSVDPYNGKCLRATAGSVFHLAVARDVDVPAALEGARTAGLRVLAATGSGESDLDDEADAGRLAGPTLWVFGNEARGLDPAVAAVCDARVSVPLYGRAESLNLASAAAVCLYASAKAQRT